MEARLGVVVVSKSRAATPNVSTRSPVRKRETDSTVARKRRPRNQDQFRLRREEIVCLAADVPG